MLRALNDITYSKHIKSKEILVIQIIQRAIFSSSMLNYVVERFTDGRNATIEHFFFIINIKIMNV